MAHTRSDSRFFGLKKRVENESSAHGECLSTAPKNPTCNRRQQAEIANPPNLAATYSIATGLSPNAALLREDDVSLRSVAAALDNPSSLQNVGVATNALRRNSAAQEIEPPPTRSLDHWKMLAQLSNRSPELPLAYDRSCHTREHGRRMGNINQGHMCAIYAASGPLAA
ncbi:hypothetical protein NM688_g1084 [Phlebia brevispora]|uniref:Uncharacterized protein n=1 Tax=Phlebia brevispora TaxID=194682 RepID=A0ACC1TCL9_9APHY|nr:hypothetical protein NM688_g1084 [Phlebia brevispora]